MSDPPQLSAKPKFVTVEFITKFKLSDHNLVHLVAIFVACMTFNVTILFTSGALGHRLAGPLMTSDMDGTISESPGHLVRFTSDFGRRCQENIDLIPTEMRTNLNILRIERVRAEH
ncbi:hypothetical protein LSH36_144g02056 [Paralvinella palmiformis]|uniref:Uncharacterized protein n=1 Tax=Paralvinella palmiformis TaxID=53620 RepID=A0AAD9JWP3_9ANNE|nr:hypothetical protein LSH36_144g02056 [Paralvinella palmiformis]